MNVIMMIPTHEDKTKKTTLKIKAAKLRCLNYIPHGHSYIY